MLPLVNGSNYTGVYSAAHHCDNATPSYISQSRSQDKEDQFLFSSFFKGLCGGSYVELGGLDGVRFSNSHMFHFGLQWHGVLIEPNPISFEALKNNRPADDTFNEAVCARTTDVSFINSHERAVTGVLEFMAPSFIQQWHKSFKPSEVLKIKCKPLSLIIDESSIGKGKAIDFLSLDVEGAEFEVLKTLDFKKHHFGVVFYEADEHNPIKNEAMKTMLEKHGYIFRIHTLRSNFHVNKMWHEMYAHLL